jgi:hypothetical protein
MAIDITKFTSNEKVLNVLSELNEGRNKNKIYSDVIDKTGKFLNNFDWDEYKGIRESLLKNNGCDNQSNIQPAKPTGP